jgi:tRNA A-37 threonylcarbamoyl transferase component Bud32
MQQYQDRVQSRSDLSEHDVVALLSAVIHATGRIEKIPLSSGDVWMKRQGTEKPIWWRHLQTLCSKLLPIPFLRPSMVLSAEGMTERERSTIERFAAKGFLVPSIIHSAPRVIVLGDVGPSIAEHLCLLRDTDPETHEDLLINCVEALGVLHGAGLCHGRPHVRDFFLRDGQIGFLDFEERPEEVMSVETAQARDLWLLFLPVASLSQNREKTLPIAFEKWRSRAPEATQVELHQMIALLGRFLPIVRLIGRVRMGSDLRRFILATEFLKTALETDAALNGAGKAGKDDRT